MQSCNGSLTSLQRIRNAGQGTTSQLVTAPCIHQLVGTKLNTTPAASAHEIAANSVDLLMWEFAMNDELPFVLRPEVMGEEIPRDKEQRKCG